jgi:hypothetical protein
LRDRNCGRPSWRRSGARRLQCIGKSAGKSSSHSTASITARKRAGAFLSRAGPRFLLDLLQAEHHLVVVELLLASETTKATLWVALG